MSDTPMMRQYRAIKAQYPDAVLFYRLGDFYEMFEDDARLASKELELTLTTRDKGKAEDERIPMCGVPYHSSEAYIARLLAKGIKVAICEQMEDPATTKGLVERDVVRVITPGTVMESAMLETDRATYLAAVCLDETHGAVCFADISTGEISATSFAGENVAERLVNELGRFAPSEAVLDIPAAKHPAISGYFKQNRDCLCQTDEERFAQTHAAQRVTQQFGRSLEELGIATFPLAVSAVGGLLAYLSDTQKRDLAHINTLNYYKTGAYMELDLHTRRNLELTESLRNREKKGSLLWVLDRTKTPMGARLLRSWMVAPLLCPVAIRARLEAVGELVADTVSRGELTLALRDIGDLERLIGKAVYGTAGGRDLRTMSLSLSKLPLLTEKLAGKTGAKLRGLAGMDLLDDMQTLIDRAISDDPPFSVREGGIIKDGYDPGVDRLRELLQNSTGALTRIEAEEQARTGFKKLKIGYNKVFGYYIELPRSMSDKVPDDYVRKQTLANCERFITQPLKELEVALMTAKDSLETLEFDLFTQVRETVAAEVTRFQQTGTQVAELDVLTALADVAARQNYTMPEVDDGTATEIQDGRHPIVEVMQTDSLFVANDTLLDNGDNRALIITGPNMAGKSTYMRQTALIVLMAQIGSFVPAKYARIGVVDRVFTRIGASDDLAAGQSTFMVEMTEVADILKHATAQSLVILDEVGRGTSTYDGMSIARAVLEYGAQKRTLGAKILFATHYHELTVLEQEISGVKNYHIAAKKRGDDIIFLRKIVPGSADDSYGIEVAKLAGVPAAVVRRAKAVLEAIEAGEHPSPGSTRPARSVEAPTDQLSLTDMGGSRVAERLQNTDLNTLTPLEAMNLLYELKQSI